VRRFAIAVTLVALAVVFTAVLVCDRAMHDITTPRDPAAEDVLLTIPPDATADAVLDLLQGGGVARQSWFVDLYVDRFRRGRPLKPGEYRLSAGFSLAQLLDIVEAGDVVTHTVVLRPGWTAEEVAEALHHANIVDRAAFLDVVRSPDAARFLGVPAERLDGFLFPDVYAFPRAQAPIEVARTLVRRFF